MCLVLTFVFGFLSYSFFSDGDMANGSINGVIALGFAVLLTRNILKTRKEKNKDAR